MSDLFFVLMFVFALVVGVLIPTVLVMSFVALIKKVCKKPYLNLKKRIKIMLIIIGSSFVGIILFAIIGSVVACDHAEYKIIETQEASCTTMGLITKECIDCGERTTEEVEARHIWKEEKIIEATCVEHKQIFNICSVCGETQVITDDTFAKHAWEVVEQKSSSCVSPKQILKKCKLCGDEKIEYEGEKAPHTYGAWETRTLPTTEDSGLRARKCSVCNDIQTEIVGKISPITILSWSYEKDFLDGVQWTFNIKNNSKKVIKYITLEWSCYNAVGDKVYDQIALGLDSSVRCKFTGPLDPGKSKKWANGDKFYNATYDHSVLNEIVVEYMDGETIKVTDKEYSDIFK